MTPRTEHAVWQELVDSGQLSKQARLLMTGHSLGGALAVLAAFDIKRAMPDFQVKMYTYGTPYPGNRAFAHEFNELLPHTWHIIHDGVSSSRSCSTCTQALLAPCAWLHRGQHFRPVQDPYSVSEPAEALSHPRLAATGVLLACSLGKRRGQPQARQECEQQARQQQHG